MEKTEMRGNLERFFDMEQSKLDYEKLLLDEYKKFINKFRTIYLYGGY